MASSEVARSGSAVGAIEISDDRRTPAGRILRLDGLRGLAIILVMAFHFATVVGWSFQQDRNLVGVDTAWLKVSGVGWCGVDLFFVLSGFLITGILCGTREVVSGYFRTFYARRFLRIFPVYYAFLVLLLLLLPLVAEQSIVDAFRERQWWYWTYTSNLRPGLPNALTPDLLVDVHLWSLAVEEQFYLVWPVLVLLLSRRQLMAACAIMIVAAPVLRLGLNLSVHDPGLGYTLMPARMDALAVGAIIALALRDMNDFAWLRRFVAPVIGVAAALLLALFVTRDGLYSYDVWVEVVGLSAFAALWGAVLVGLLSASPGSLAVAVSSHAVSRWFGRYSYAMYLVHWPVAALIGRRVDIPAHVGTVFGSRLAGAAAFELLAGGISVLAAWLSWQLLEKQVLRLKVRFDYEATAAAEVPA